METQHHADFQRIAEAITYIKCHFKEQPSLDQIADHVHVSPSHFQRMFTNWAGTTPKKFLQYISIEHAKKVLRVDQQSTLFDTAYETGLSSTSRLHDLFIGIEGMTPAEYKHGGRNLQIKFSFKESPFGRLIVASTNKGICFIGFVEDNKDGLGQLSSRFPNARTIEEQDPMHDQVLSFFQQDWTQLPQIKLHLKGTDFQLKVWEALLKIPIGRLSTYGMVADGLGNPKASRAVGTAIGSNPIAYLIPCHRVIQSTGAIGGYMWNPVRKTAIIGWEYATNELQTSF